MRIHGFRQGPHGQSLGQPWNAFEEDMAIGQKANEHPFDQIVLPHNHATNFLLKRLYKNARLLYFFVYGFNALVHRTLLGSFEAIMNIFIVLLYNDPMKKKIRFYDTTVSKPRPIKTPKGRLGVLLPGMGAVASTFIAGVLSARKGLGKPIGSLTQMGAIRIGKRTDHNNPRIKDFVPLADLKDLVFGGWDIFPDNMYQAACKAGVLEHAHLTPIRKELEQIKPMKAVFDANY